MRSTSAQIPSPRPEVGAADQLATMLANLASSEVRIVGASELATICDIGARYAVNLLESSLPAELAGYLSLRARQSLRADIRRHLSRMSRANYKLETKSHD